MTHSSTLVCSDYWFCGTSNYRETHSFPISSIQDEPVLGDQARLGRSLNLQGLTRSYRPAKQR